MNNQNIPFNNEIKNSYNNTNQKSINNLGFQGKKQNNSFIFGKNYLNPSFTNILPNSQNNSLFQNYQPQKIQYFPNNYKLNGLYPPPNIMINNLGKDPGTNNFNIGEKYNNILYYQMPLRNTILQPLPNTIISTNNIVATSIPNNYTITNNNTNINKNSNLNSDRNINNIKTNSEKTNLINNNGTNNQNNTQIIKDSKDKINNPLDSKNSMNKTKINNINSKENNNDNNNNNKNKEEKNDEKIFPEKNTQTPSTKLQNEITKTKAHKVFFNIKESVPRKDGNMLSKKRKRFIKNNKLVFVQKDENEFSSKVEKIYDQDEGVYFLQNPKPRGSRFRGVSKNGSQWQVLIMVKKKKRYLGSFSSEEEAARAYDKVALQNHGNKAKTNFDYTKEEIEKILKGPNLLKFQ